MILILCPSCRCALRVSGDTEEMSTLVGPQSEFWPDKFHCYKCDGPARGFLESEISLKASVEMKDVNPQEAFAAIHGLGTLDERECDKLMVTGLLKEHPIRNLVGKDIPGSGRVMVDYLELWDGTRLHFGSSNEGAVIYRITRPPNYAERVKT